jgi:hypothetical protein
VGDAQLVLDVGHHWVRASGSRALRADTHHPTGPGLPVPCFLKRERTVPIVPRLLIDLLIYRTKGPSFMVFLVKAEMIASHVGT